MVEPVKVVDVECHTGEGPLWHPGQQLLYWVDIPRGRLYAYDPCRDSHQLAYEREGAIGGFTIQRDGCLLLFEEAGRIETLDLETGERRTVVDAISGERTSRFNDVVADPRGRVFCGTMPHGESPGRLYRLDTDGSWIVIEEGVGISNGLGFATDCSRLYHVETESDAIYTYDYESETGRVSNRRVFVDAADEPGHPDGMTVDSTGSLWIAFWDGSRVVRYDSNGERVAHVEFPARKVSAITFGGPAYTDAYVTTALAGDERTSEGSGAGALFRFDPGVRGIVEFCSDVTPE